MLMLRQVLQAILVALTIAQCSTALAIERRVALVIGNAKYKEAPLYNPVNDARDMAAALQRTGFEVIIALDATQKEMNRAIARFGERLTLDSVALFYYAGHGMQVRGKNYLIPIDAEIKTESSVRVESVDVDGVLDQLSTSELNVVILDACRNNPFERRANRSVGAAGLAQMEAPKGSLIAYATAPGRTAADGEGRNGLYTQELLKQLQVPGLTIEQVFKNVRREVAKATRDGQIPWESSSMTGDFYFMPVARPSAASVQPIAVRPLPVATASPAQVQDLKQAPAPTRQNGGASSGEAAPAASAQKPAALTAESPPATAPAAPVPPRVETLAAVTPTPVPPEAAPITAVSKSDPVLEAKERVIKTEAFTATGRLSLDRSSGAMSGEGTIEWVNGDRYEGTMASGRKHGKGIFTWSNGQRYEGEWADDMINGKGIMYYTNGDRYEGTFKDGEPHGTGSYTVRNGDVYTGAWVSGNRHGFGRLTWSTGDYWEGEFRDGKQTDNGRMHSTLSVIDKSAEPAAATSDKSGARKKGK
ncbi:MAG TPA: caspase family protein [Accumulibacter sp.]|uniref:caspase family protein n=2 Tax=Accumulibacter sp. TaxID=2053492 RepID=UPI00261C7063|nr:caspase family protein [Accumulibacter sp.]MDS4054007.1 caspase family protein [Accumulibacter sp.]HMV03914.1 caspase family protein [Accumulibacter sp.]HMW63824.1 caspase family protein [Accumulibacter sp.]HMW79387.1 caspase family protein [Accumulibacter sp.]HMX68850.1 caspase family protein [Accumulibacter sp.]